MAATVTPVALSQEMLRLFYETVGQLPINPLFDTPIQRVPFAVQADDQGGKGPFGKPVLLLKLGHRDAG